MTQFNPFLKLNRLTIFTKNGSKAYDAEFHNGVNIIRGMNSSGKSTIANFIFYVLGGDFTKWTTAAKSCGDIYAEVFINSELITLKRTVSDSKNQPMLIFWGKYDDALSSSSEGWQIFPYKRSGDKKSFSNALFLSLGLPELRGDVDSNITMHQILRLLYVDQKSLTLDLLMTDSFDSAITRRTIVDLLFGVYSDSLYSDKLNLRDSIKEFDIKKRQFEGIENILKLSYSETIPANINDIIENNNNQISIIDERLQNFENYNIAQESIESQSRIENLKFKLIGERKKMSFLQSKINEYEFELLDSSEFISSLEKRIISLSDSFLTRDSFSDLKMSHCPSCLQLLEDVQPNHCELCQRQLPEDKGASQIKRMQQEIDNQIRESKKLYLEKEHTLLELKSSYPTIEQNIRELQREVDFALSNVKNERHSQIDSYLIKKGELISQNDFLLRQLKALEQIQVIKSELEGLSTKIANLRTSILSKESEQNARLSNAYSLIQSNTLKLLHSDLGRQPEFHSGRNVELDFDKNTFALDGENNFSESSNVYLKNSVRFAMFFASLEKDFFRLPRFILCDNIEDKGMEPARSQSFQRELVKMSEESKVNHQIIITTSMIAPELNNNILCIGEFHTTEIKTLKLD